jgi:hypothetical protein
MLELGKLEASLEDRGFTRIEPDGSPSQLRWYHRPLDWRERMPLVRGYRRTVVLVDVPLRRPDRLHDLFEEIANLTGAGLAEGFSGTLKPQTPFWAYPLYLVAFIVALAAGYFVGVSLEMEDHDWLVVLFPSQDLGPQALAALGDAAGAGERFTAVSLALESSNRLLIPLHPPARWGQHAATAKAALKDINRHLGEGFELQRLDLPTAPRPAATRA